MKICPKCKAECEDQMKFCLNCGEPFEISEEPEAAPEPLPAQEPAAEATGSEMPAQDTPAQTGTDKPKKEKKAERSASRKSMSVLAVLSVIFAIIGVFAGGYACLLSFLNIVVALIFYVPSVLGIVFGLIALRNTGKERKYKGRILAYAGIIFGILAIVLWLIGTFYLRGRVAAEFGTMDLMSVVRVITTKM